MNLYSLSRAQGLPCKISSAKKKKKYDIDYENEMNGKSEGDLKVGDERVTIR